eukprot:336983-Hanusia_phi.AAC.1
MMGGSFRPGRLQEEATGGDQVTLWRCRCGGDFVCVSSDDVVEMTFYTQTQTTEAVDRKRMAVRTIIKLQPTKIVDERQ